MITRLAFKHNDNNNESDKTSRVDKIQSNGKNENGNNNYNSLSPIQVDQISESTSTSSLSNTDSDSLRSNSRLQMSCLSNSNITNTKSPILIKYNYYDNNGARQEQTNHDMNYNHSLAGGAKVQRQLSPSFKQHLDQIVRNSQQQQVAKGFIATPPSSPEEQQQQMVHFARRYKLSSYEQRCLRCKKTVYQMDKVGPLKDFTFYHQNCFKCRKCGTKLTLKTYFNNQQYSGDQEVYCHRHCPKTEPGKLDNQSVGIRAALNAPKVFDGSILNSHNFIHEGPINGPLSPTGRQQHLLADGTPNVDSSALHIQHAVQQTRLQNIYKHSQVDKKISQFINKRLEFLEPKQKLLEMRHREEEDALFKAFEIKWRQEESCISEQIRDEWQVELSKLLEKYKRQLSNISHQAANHHLPLAKEGEEVGLKMVQQQLQYPQQKALTTSKVETTTNKNLVAASSQQQQQQMSSSRQALSKQEMIEFERMNLEKTMTIKLDRKKETLKRKLKEFERQATAELVEKQSKEMLALISMKLEEYKEEQKRKIGSDLEQFEALESLANQLGSSLQLADLTNGNYQGKKEGFSLIAADEKDQLDNCYLLDKHGKKQGKSNETNPTRRGQFETPPPRAPQISKMDLYNSEEPDEVFKDIDALAINVAREDQQTFTDLVHHLTRHCLTDVEKARAIFRWITVKNLNTMQFDSSIKPDTPLGLLRGIKNGSESYHVLFKRLCSYAGLHCVVIKGYSKSAGYQPGVKFEGGRFRNSWNAVFVAGAWRFVQCNWGARHLVSVAVMQDKNQPTTNNGSSKRHSNGLEASRHQQQLPQTHAVPVLNANRSQAHHLHHSSSSSPTSYNLGRRRKSLGITNNAIPYAQLDTTNLNQDHQHLSPIKQHNFSSSSSPSSSQSYSTSSDSPVPRLSANSHSRGGHQSASGRPTKTPSSSSKSSSDSLRYEYDDHYFLTDPDEFIYEFFPLSPEWQLIKTRPITLNEFERLPFVRSLFFKYGLYFPQQEVQSVLYTDTSGATTVKIGMPTHMIPSLIFHYNLKYYDSDLDHYEGVSLKRFVMQSVESGASDGANGQVMLSNIVSFRVHLPEDGVYILDIFANSTTPTQYITGEPMKFKSVCKFKIVAKNLKTVMIPLPDCASGEYGPMKATRLFGIIPLTHENGLITVQNDKRSLEIQFRMTRTLVDFMASLHKNGYDERQLSKLIKIFVEGDIITITIKFFEDGQYGLDVYTRDHVTGSSPIERHKKDGFQTSRDLGSTINGTPEPKKQLLTHCCKYLINVRASSHQ